MLKKEDALKDRNEIKKRATGALIGLAVGDSFGDASRMQANRENYGFITDFSAGSAWSTDDTEFALLTAKTLIRCKGKLTSEEVVKSWMEDVVVQDEYKRGGASEKAAADNLRAGLLPPLTGKYSTFNMSDGSAMRIPPIGIMCTGDPEKAAALAQIESEISHAGDGVWGAQAVAAAVAVAMADGTIDEIFEAAMAPIPQDSWLYYSMTKVFDIIEKENYDIASCWMKIHDATRASTWATTAEAVPAAFGCLKLMHKDFKSAVLLAGNFARDADTIGAIAGSVMGAKYSIDGIPEHWVKKVRYPSGTCLQFTKGLDIIEIAEKLAELNYV